MFLVGALFVWGPTSPTAPPTISPAKKWIPPYRREMPASLAASVKVFQVRVTGCAGVKPCSTFELPAAKVTEPPKVSLRVKRFRISAPAALKLLCPEMDSGKGGVGNRRGWQGIQNLPSLVTIPCKAPPHAST